MMRAKLVVQSVKLCSGCEILELFAVGRTSPYMNDGKDEDNTYAKFSPSASLTISIANPDLFGKFKPGQKFYVDFTEVPPCASCPAPK